MMRYKGLGVVLAIAALGVLPAAGRPDESTGKTGPATIRVTGEATVTAKPDQAEIDLGVMTEAATGQAAAAQNAQKQDAVLAELRKMLGPGAEIKTIGYSLSPNYRYPKEGGQPVVSGYTASNVVQVKTNDLAQVAEGGQPVRPIFAEAAALRTSAGAAPPTPLSRARSRSGRV